MAAASTSAPPPAVRDARPSETGVLADVLARSFWDDPVMEWLMPDARTRYHRGLLFYRAEMSGTHRRGRVLTTNDLAGAALWLPPGKWRTPQAQVLRQTPNMVRALAGRLRAGLELLAAVEEAHPKEPHWYLAILGTDPSRQGRGVGGQLITAVTDDCDRIGLGAFLESSKEGNIPYYERFGFKVTGEIRTSGHGPTLWSMWRDPR